MIFNLLPDHRADAFNPSSKENGGILDEVLKVTLDGYHKWDAKYFLFIAENGYAIVLATLFCNCESLSLS